MFKRIITTSLVFGAAALAPPAMAQTPVSCGNRDAVVEVLSQRYKEFLSGAGLQSEQHIVEIWSSPQSGTFTILMTRADGVSCIVASGRNWNDIVAPAEEGVAG